MLLNNFSIEFALVVITRSVVVTAIPVLKKQQQTAL